MIAVLCSLLFLILSHGFSSSTLQELRFTNCDYTKRNYTSSSPFSTNLGLALAALRTNTSATGFSTATTANNSSGSVTALALCRGSLNQTECQACTDAATSGVRDACPDQTEAQVWYTYCTVRYSSDNFVNKSDNSLVLMLYDVRSPPLDPIIFDQIVNDFVLNLSVIAGAADKRYAVAKTGLPRNMSLYGYVDCSRDVDGDSCKNCLAAALEGLQGCCSGKWASWVATPDCSIQVNLDPVHDDWKVAKDISTFMPAPAPAPEGGTGKFPVEGGFGSGGGDGGNRVKIGVAIGGAGGGVILVVVVLCVVFRGKRELFGGETFLYDLDLLVAATQNFSASNLLGRGGFGTVYKGLMADGEEVAVKMLTGNSVQGHEEFLNEIRLLLKTQHRNLVRLFGCCTQGDHKMLVYEYLPNNSLDSFLFDKSKSAILDWPKRYNIIIGIARALLYLHQDCAFKIVHRDIKASNVLLDEHMNPKVSDFGLAKLFTDDQESNLRTRRIAGTFGYMAPEYAMRGLVSTKGDVFSFGVLLLEIISGRKNFDPQYDEMEMQQLLKHTWRLEQEGRVMEMVDVTIGAFPRDEVLRCIRVGLLCAQRSIQDRPTMASAMVMLSNYSTTIPLPGFDETIEPATNATSENSITISYPTGRQFVLFIEKLTSIQASKVWWMPGYSFLLVGFEPLRYNWSQDYTVVDALGFVLGPGVAKVL